jgi:hypothetical protein
MSKPQSDAYYMAQLVERLGNLEVELTRKLSADAELTGRAKKLLSDLNHLLSQGDDFAQDMLEYSLLPKMNSLLLDTRQQLKLKSYARKAVSSVSHAKRREQIIQERLSGPPAHPHPGAYVPIPMPLRDEERCALIEDALHRLKVLLSDA